MKRVSLSIILLAFISLTSFAQKINYNLDDGYIAGGYDVVAYFSKKAVEGKSTYKVLYKGAKYKFSSQANLDKFKASPSKYAPQYGGWCAYAIGAKSKKVDIDPETYEIRNGKLYLFYNSWGNNTYESWIEGGADKLKIQADKNWPKMKYEED